MSKYLKKLTLLLFLIAANFFGIAQKTLPKISLISTEGELYNIEEIGKDRTIIVAFWATWCVPCIKELDAINDLYPDWQEETNVELIAVSIDDSRTSARVKPMVNGKGWEYKILLDPNQDFKRAMNIVSVPYLIIVKNGEIVYKHSGYTPGSEYGLYDEILKLNN